MNILKVLFTPFRLVIGAVGKTLQDPEIRELATDVIKAVEDEALNELMKDGNVDESTIKKVVTKTIDKKVKEKNIDKTDSKWKDLRALIFRLGISYARARYGI